MRRYPLVGLAAATLVTVTACGGSGDNNAKQQTAPPPSKSSTASPSQLTSSSPSDAGTTMNMGGNHAPIPANTQVINTGEIFNKDRKGVVYLYGRTPFGLSWGTAFIHDLDGEMAITNAHVVDGLTGVKARFWNGEVVPVHVMGSDPCSDLAVVHFSGPLPAGTVRLPLGDSDHLHPGDTVTALGYPVTASANVYLPHLIPTTGTIQDPRVRYNDEPDIAAVIAIQHGATIQHGNSGGPLTDDKGNVIGINTLLGPEGTQSQYYALPIKEAHAETDKLMKGESVNNLGWSLTAHSVHPYNSEEIYGEKGNEIEQYLKKQGIRGGMIVKSVQAGGPVDQKVQQLDLITAISNRSVNSMAQTCDIIESALPGRDTISLDGIHLDRSQSNYGKTFHVALKMPGSH